MKRCVVCAVLCLLTLVCGCGRQEAAREVFFVQDEIEAPTQQRLRYTIRFEPPDGAKEVLKTEDVTRCEAEDGSYVITTQVFPFETAAEAIRAMTGSEAEALRPVETRRMDMAEYRFCWCVEAEHGTYLCTGDLLADEDCCYGIAVCLREDAAPEYREMRKTALETFSLFYDEGF